MAWSGFPFCSGSLLTTVQSILKLQWSLTCLRKFAIQIGIAFFLPGKFTASCAVFTSPPHVVLKSLLCFWYTTWSAIFYSTCGPHSLHIFFHNDSLFIKAARKQSCNQFVDHFRVGGRHVLCSLISKVPESSYNG